MRFDVKGKIRKKLIPVARCVFFLLVLSGKVWYSFGEEERDIFSPLISENGRLMLAEAVQTNALTLQGIVYSEKGNQAIISNELVKEGEILGEYTILKVEKEHVILKKNDKEVILRMEEEK